LGDRGGYQGAIYIWIWDSGEGEMCLESGDETFQNVRFALRFDLGPFLFLIASLAAATVLVSESTSRGWMVLLPELPHCAT
jgi:hypothetical protein